MGVGPVCQTSLPTGFSEWELGPRHAEQPPIVNDMLLLKGSPALSLWGVLPLTY